MAMRGKVILAAMLAASLTTLAACVGSSSDTPEWFNQREGANTSGYPSLHDVPTSSRATTDPAHWAAVEAEVSAAGAAMKANPRSEPAGPTNPEAFIDDARGELEEARASHEP